jgi:hypothetical protein
LLSVFWSPDDRRFRPSKTVGSPLSFSLFSLGLASG